jgi:hypothetical protein
VKGIAHRTEPLMSVAALHARRDDFRQELERSHPAGSLLYGAPWIIFEIPGMNISRRSNPETRV